MSVDELQGVHYRGQECAADNDGFRPPYESFQVPSRTRRAKLEQLLRADRSVVLSSENFLGSPNPYRGEPYCQAAELAAAMRDYFLDQTEFRVVIYVRPQHEWLDSLFNQYAKSWVSTYPLNPIEFAERSMGARYFQWTSLINDLKAEVGPDRLIVRPYRPDTNITADFLTCIGVPTPERLLTAQPENRSLAPEQLALRQRMAKSLTAAGNPNLAYWVHKLDEDSKSQPPTPIHSLFPEEIQAQLIEIAKVDWRRLSSTVADMHLGEPHLFESIAEEVEQARIKPYTGPLETLSIDNEALRILAEALPYVRTHPKSLPLRVKSVLVMARHQLSSNPRALVRTTMAFRRRRAT